MKNLKKEIGLETTSGASPRKATEVSQFPVDKWFYPRVYSYRGTVATVLSRTTHNICYIFISTCDKAVK